MVALSKLIHKWACSHKWDEISNYQIYSTDESELPSSLSLIVVCKVCGKIKKIKQRF